MAIKVNELAKALGVTEKEIMKTAISMGVAVKTPSSPIEDKDAAAIRQALAPAQDKKTAKAKSSQLR